MENINQEINEEKFEEIITLTLKELPKNMIIFDRVYEGVLLYHCAKNYIYPTTNEIDKLIQVLKSKTKGE